MLDNGTMAEQGTNLPFPIGINGGDGVESLKIDLVKPIHFRVEPGFYLSH